MLLCYYLFFRPAAASEWIPCERGNFGVGYAMQKTRKMSRTYEPYSGICLR